MTDELHDELAAALELLLKTAQHFERQAGRGVSSRRGGPVFTKSRAALISYRKAKEKAESHD